MSPGQYIDPAASRVTFRQYAEKWLSTRVTDVTTRESVDSTVRGHAIPYLGSRPLGSFKPEHIRDWLSKLERAVQVSTYRRVIYNNVPTILNAAVADGHLPKNACHARSLRPPAAGNGRVVPWPSAWPKPPHAGVISVPVELCDDAASHTGKSDRPAGQLLSAAAAKFGRGSGRCVTLRPIGTRTEAEDNLSTEVHVSITPRGMSVQEAYRLFRDDSLLVNRRYQRKLVWAVAEKQLLIRSILDGYPIPLILLAERPEIHGAGKYEIIDGMQRLDAIFSFIEQSFDYEGMYFDLNQSARARQAANAGAFSPVDALTILPAEKCANILDYQLAVTIFPTHTEQQITEVFSRINSNGRQLSVQEKRQAGMLNPFSETVRSLASSLRGDVSEDVLLLHDMPSISIDSARERQQYGVKAEDTLWIRHGILNVKQLREGDDEQMVADIAASILFGEPFAASKEAFDELYDTSNEKYRRLDRTLAAYGIKRLESEIQTTFSVLSEVIDSELTPPNGLRNLVRPGGSNPIRTPFYAIFMAFFELIVKQQKSPDDYAAIIAALRNVGQRLKTGRHYISTEDRVSNIDAVTGLIQRYFVAKVPPVFGHGPGLALDFENSLRRSRIETSRYEFKQGLLRLDDRRQWDDAIIGRLAETICGIANVKPRVDGYLYLGVADKESDAARIKSVDRIEPIAVGPHHVVGVDREARNKKISLDNYVQRFVARISQAGLSEPLSPQLLSNVDTIEYKGLSVIRILIPGQSDLSYCNDAVFVRRGSSTERIDDVKQVVALGRQFA